MIRLGWFVFLVGRNAAAAVDGPAAVGALHIHRILGVGVLAVVVIEERDVGVIALDQATAGSVIMRGSKGEAGVVLKRIDGLNQSLAEGSLTQNPGAVVILERAGHDFGGRG